MSTGLILGITLGTVAVLSCVVLVVVGVVTGKPDTSPAAATAGPATQARTTAAGNPAPTSAKASPSPAMVTMPDLVKKNAAIAQDELEQLGFTRIQFGSQDAEDTVVLLASNWTVTKQSTPAGTQVSTSTLIVLTCTKKA
ncbi:PASTA domain-containing protein [Dactylosporangium sp. CA-152071]|uniref:PASTA domain-containing protein n=1 Tax=Dactylosporangium sp. CA-152071 TaxID=3239933 RepID=UPI003D8EB2AB